MRLLIIRHAEPDYSIDSLTEKGWREAGFLADMLEKEKLDYIYVSPLGRARATIAPTLERTGKKAEVRDFLREFEGQAKRPDTGKPGLAWDLLPGFVNTDPKLFDPEHWTETDTYKDYGMAAKYSWVTGDFDALLAEHGYERDGLYYRVTAPNRDTVVLVCHFGVECVLLSHLLNISPVPLWQGAAALPSSVTTVYTEERRKGIAQFRMSRYGDISHLNIAGEQPSFMVRFCETFDSDERHD